MANALPDPRGAPIAPSADGTATTAAPSDRGWQGSVLLDPPSDASPSPNPEGDEPVGVDPAGARPAWASQLARYQRVSLLGRGGMGSVWLGRDTVLDREVAIKVPGPDGRHARLLHREARWTAGLTHPGIVTVLDVTTIDGWPCFVMPRVDGTSLAALIDAAASRENRGTAAVGPIHEGPTLPSSLIDRVRWLVDAADAVAYAHERGIVHGDLSPANVLVERTGRVVVIDWGLARRVGERDAADAPAGGTRGFTPPEGCAGAADPRADVWSLGAVLVELVLAPAGTASPSDAVARIPDERLRAIAALCLAVDATTRPKDARAVHGLLCGWLAREEQRVRGTVGPRRWLVWSAAAAALAVGWTGVAAWHGHVDRQRAEAVAEAQQSRVAMETSRALGLLEGGHVVEARQVLRPLMDGPWVDATVRGAWIAAHQEVAIEADVRAAVPASCRGGVVQRRGARRACAGTAEVVVWEDDEPLWSVRLGARDVAFEGERLHVLDGDRALHVLDGETGGLVFRDERLGKFAAPGAALRITWDRTGVLLPGVEAPGAEVAAPCRDGIVTARLDGTSLAVACVEGGAWVLDTQGAHPPMQPAGADTTEVFEALLALPADGPPRLVAATRQGDLLVLGGGTERVRWSEPVVQLERGADAGSVVAATAGGALRYVDVQPLSVRADLGRLRGTLHPMPNGLWVTGEDEEAFWRWPTRLPRRTLRTGHGFSAVAWTPAGDAVVALDSAGRVLGLRPSEGVPLRPQRWGPGVGMSLAPDPSSGRSHLWLLGMGGGGPQAVRVDNDALHLAPPLPIDGALRQVLRRTATSLLLVSYEFGMIEIDESTGLTTHHLPRLDVRAATTDEAGTVWAAAADGLWRLDPDGATRHLGPERAWTHIVRLPTGTLAVSDGPTLVLLGPDGTPRATHAFPAPIRSLARAPNGSALASGLHDGTIWLLDPTDATPWATWSSHAERVSGLAFAPDGCALASVSWDGVLRVAPLGGATVAREDRNGAPLRDGRVGLGCDEGGGGVGR